MDNADDFYVDFEQKLSDLFENKEVFNHVNFGNDGEFDLKFHTIAEEVKEAKGIPKGEFKYAFKSISEYADYSNQEDIFSIQNPKNQLNSQLDEILKENKNAEEDQEAKKEK
mmetsp:Transcript_13228/g.15328  ORF Transcript_13228/g.15328 Transcript_13228/m.15328 type:complete len:112 (-) Transcript_13228:979-1314(-)|eukprot:CAMPEP_0168321210 /NCGR_PEP_ID=MMETSP0213-20121227/2134_1 /TAXON_ID=151035 /ORGANISM="Euplotes harpa, Strain FSP1.4" /LENGTH=111 /DNA_ID=CAMNT_0008322815 /DNA_START=21 /DNA_END=356 /DNA_ORIENTATION=+